MKKHLLALDTTPLVSQREWTVDGIPVLSAEISLPEPTSCSDRVSRRIRRYYRLQRRAFLHYCDGWLFPQAAAEYRSALAASTPLPHAQAQLFYQITYQKDGLWSLYTQSRETGLPGHTLLQRHGDTWDLVAGYPAPLFDFLPRSRGKRVLLDTAAQEIDRQERAGIARYHDHWRQKLRRTFNSQNFYLTDEGLAFFYPMHAIAPAAEGIPTFLLPFSALSEPGRLRPNA